MFALSDDLLNGVRDFGRGGVVMKKFIANGGEGGPIQFSGDGKRFMRSASNGTGAAVIAALMLHRAVAGGYIPVGYVCESFSVLVSGPGCAYQPWHCDLWEEQRYDIQGHLYYSALYFVDASDLLVDLPCGGRRVSLAAGDMVVFGGGCRHGGGCNPGEGLSVRVHTFFRWAGHGGSDRPKFFNYFKALDAAEQTRLNNEAMGSEVVLGESVLSFTS